MDARSTLKNTKRNVWAAALLMVFGLAWITPQAFAQILPPLPLPGGSLIVTITSPAPGSSVSGTTPVNASVSIVGSLTVSQVQFFRDGNFIGSDSSAPYSVSWNTTSTNNGSHTLTAVATDILGVRCTADPATVAVSNGPPPDTTPPSVPTGLRATAVSSSQINLSWAASADNVGVSGYRVYRGGTQIATTSATSFTDTGLSPSTTYSYAVAAFDAAGNLSAQSSPASATTPAASDTTPPTVSITSPKDGETVKGTVTVTASASDNVGVAGVQFFGDGKALAPEVTTAPYSISVDTTTTNDGPHRLTAIARDAAGNRSDPSAPVPVTVANNAPPPPPPPPPGTATRLQETDASISYTAGTVVAPDWTQFDTSRAWSAGLAALSKVPGAKATITFDGTGISWIGARGPQTGIARVTLDGVAVPPIATYLGAEEIQAGEFTKNGPSHSSHTLSGEVTGRPKPKAHCSPHVRAAI